jgi:AcrR family transcriptional regulator
VPENVKRNYRSERRAQQARETRAAIVQAARALFVERGYAATSVQAIAEAAGVANETVYAIFKNKRAVLEAIENEAITGDAELVPLFERPFIDAARKLTDPRARIRAMRPGLEAAARVAEIASVMRGAAASDETVAAVWKERETARYADVERMVALVAEVGPLRLEFRDTVDLTWVLGSPDVCYELVVERGWPVDRYVTVISELLETLVGASD